MATGIRFQCMKQLRGRLAKTCAGSHPRRYQPIRSITAAKAFGSGGPPTASSADRSRKYGTPKTPGVITTNIFAVSAAEFSNPCTVRDGYTTNPRDRRRTSSRRASSAAHPTIHTSSRRTPHDDAAVAPSLPVRLTSRTSTVEPRSMAHQSETGEISHRGTEAGFLYRHQVGTNTPFAHHHSFSISILASFIHKRRPTIGSSKADPQELSLRLCDVSIKARLSLGGRSGSVMRNDRTLS